MSTLEYGTTRKGLSCMKSEEDPVAICGKKLPLKTRTAAEGMITPCVKEPKHIGPHVYCLRVRAGLDHRSHALHYQEQQRDGSLKNVMMADVKDPMSTQDECAALWQIMEWQREHKDA